ncbi:Gfo/Idh/MocA family protein [Streptomyces sp. NPDC017556]|uniref:Gfo/Idh/MocA family protein n=1 Tax=Streptomyces sp. NPDC017556 TaxID=3365002 RepID=UPI0037ACA034
MSPVPTGRDGPAGSPVRVGVLGCADIALRRMLPAIAAADSARLVAVASRDAAKAERVAARFGCAGVKGYRTLLKRDDIDAVYIPLPPALHFEQVAEALLAGKHVLCEKPLCTTRAETAELMELARHHRRILTENYMFLHHSQHTAVRSLLDEGAIGELEVLSASFGVPPLDPTGFRYAPSLGGGALLDVGVYPLRTVQMYLPGKPEVLAATLRVDSATGVDVAGTVLLSAPDGTAAQLAYGFRHSYRSRYTLWGGQGQLSAERAYTPPEHLKPVIRLQQQDRLTELTTPADHQVHNALTAFTDAVLTGRNGPLGETESLLQAQLAEDIRNIARITTN